MKEHIAVTSTSGLLLQAVSPQESQSAINYQSHDDSKRKLYTKLSWGHKDKITASITT
jgi:hypothetical protein